MHDTMAQTQGGLVPLDLPSWKTAVSWCSAILVFLLFIISGLWKITDVQGAAMRMAQARVPESLSLAAALVFGIVETFGAVLILVPRFRRWGAIVTGLLLVAFVVFMAVNYNALRGEDCSCFPWVKRIVGPGFFISDAIMLLLAIFAGVWSKPPESLRSAVLVLGAVSVFALVSYGVVTVYQSGTRAPATVQVDGRPYSLQHGRILVYFFDPMCSHCLEVAKRMARLRWADTQVVAVPVEETQFAGGFLAEAGLRAVISTDFKKLASTFAYKTYPFGVAVENGREKAALTRFDGNEPVATLKRLGFAY